MSGYFYGMGLFHALRTYISMYDITQLYFFSPCISHISFPLLVMFSQTIDSHLIQHKVQQLGFLVFIKRQRKKKLDGREVVDERRQYIDQLPRHHPAQGERVGMLYSTLAAVLRLAVAAREKV